MAASEYSKSAAWHTNKMQMEGFLCPLCMQDLRSFRNLQRHFESEHSNEDKAIMNQIKDVFSKAKDKLFSKDADHSASDSNPASRSRLRTPTSYVGHDMEFWEPQEIGVSRHFLDKFKSVRDARIDRTVIETNKIIIRLGKILQMPDTERSRRKEFERSLVPWVQDEDVPFCPTCGDKFNLTRRRHHCRLCGVIMCARCSIFLSIREAEELIEQNRQVHEGSPSMAKSLQPVYLTLSEEDIEKISVRVCFECDKVLQRNREKLNLQLSTSLLALLHAKMITAMEAAQNLSPEFQTIAESLNNGEEEYKLDLAMEKRLRLMQAFEAVDVISKKIAVLYTEDEENPPTLGAQKLQNSIRKAACSFLQDNMLSLPSLPSAPKLLVLQARRRTENERRLRKQREEAQRLRDEQKRQQDLERELAERMQSSRRMPDTERVRYSNISAQDDGNPFAPADTAVIRDPGWSADTIPRSRKTVATVDAGENGMEDSSEEDDCDDILSPLSEQIAYVEESLNQARDAGMQAEAESLGRNLEELRLEYKRLKAQKDARAFRGSSFHGGSAQRTSSTDVADGGDAMLHQIKYITKCIADAQAAGKYDEVRILTENLEEIKQIYNQFR